MTSISNSTSSSAASALQVHQHRGGRPPQFSKLDSDGSGGLDKTEFKAMVDKRPGKTEGSSEVNIDEMFSKLDSDGDGSITETELKAGAKAQKESADNAAASMSQMGMSTQAFAGMMGPPPMGPPPDKGSDKDSDGDSTVSSSTSSTDSSSSADKLKQLLAALDTDKSGDISSTEIKAFEDQMKTLVSKLHSMAGQQYESVASSSSASASSAASSSLSVMA